jgi:putative PIN family toxin of toxin-antitoxin system
VRLVLDTNVLFAAYLARGTCATLYEQALATATLVSSEAILTEFEGKLVEKAKLPLRDAAQVRSEAASDALIVQPEALPAPVCRDADDDVILATAGADKAALIVTGDKDLLVLGNYLGIPIVTPAECLVRLGGAH